MDDMGVRAGDPFDYAASRRHDDERGRERGCFYCLSGWVFLGSLDHDGQEVFDAVRCRRCGGTGRMRFSPVQTVMHQAEAGGGDPPCSGAGYGFEVAPPGLKKGPGT